MAALPPFHQQHANAPTPEDLVVPEQAPEQSPPATQQQQQCSPPSPMVTLSQDYTSSHAFGVSFTGTANFAPLPFPPSEYPLPPPAHPAPPPVEPAQHPLPPPPPYVELSPHPQVQAHPPQFRPADSYPPHSATPFVLFAPVHVPMQWSTSPYAYGPSAMLPSMATTPMLTPWPPVPLRHIDDFLGGTYHPGTPYGSYTPLASPAPLHRHNPSPSAAAFSAAPAASRSAPLLYPISSTHPVQHQQAKHPSPPPVASSFAPQVPVSVAPAPFIPVQHTQPLSPSPTHAPAHPTSPPLEHAQPLVHELCAVAGCTAHVFCELAPCECRLCRDHLGWVIRGARTVEVDDVKGNGEDEGDGDEKRDRPRKTNKVFRCVACRAESSMAGPTPPPRAKSNDSDAGSTVGLGLTGADLPTEDELHTFSIKYVSSGPAPFAHRSPSPTSTAGAHDIDLSTALDPVGDASLVQHLPVPQPSIDLQTSSHLAPLALAATPALPPQLDLDPPDRSAADLQAVPRPPSPPFPLHAGFATHLPHADGGSLYQLVATQSSPGELTPSETVRASSESDDGAPRPSAAHPALEGVTPLSSPPLALRTRSLSRSATSPPALYIPDPLAARSAPSPPESTTTPSPVDGESPRAARASGIMMPPFAREPSSISHQRAFQAQAYPYPNMFPQQAYAAGGGRFAHSFTQPGTGTGAFAPLPLAPYAPSWPGSVSVTPQYAHALHAPPLAHAGPPLRSGRKRGSLPGGGAPGIGFARWIDRPGTTAARAPGLPASASFPPRMPPALDAEADGSKLERGRWPIVKVENIPFHTTVQDVENWLPDGFLPHESECIQPIHIVLHRATGRTLPHCYLETVDNALATELIRRMDRSQLGDRTVRVKWERPGELLRDLFAQEAYFQMGGSGPGQHVSSPAAAPLPHLPPEGFRIPDVLLVPEDLNRLVQYSVRPMQYRERPFERAFFNVATLLNKFPWVRDDLWNVDLRDMMFETTHQVLVRALGLAKQDALFVRIAHLLVKSGKACPAFTAVQQNVLAFALSSAITAHPSPASTPKKMRSAPLPALHAPPAPAPQTPPHAHRAQRLPVTPDFPASPIGPIGPMPVRAVPPHLTGTGTGTRSRGWRRAASHGEHGGETCKEARREWVSVRTAGGSGEEVQSRDERKGWAEGSSDEEPVAQDPGAAAQAGGGQIDRPLSVSAFPPLPAKPTAPAAGLDTPPASPETFRSGRRV
ncbi:hypothetical protein JCM3770_007061 [Rhodotorula araucariae]